MKTKFVSILMTAVLSIFGMGTRAQENTLLYEVSGNGLDQPSYVFGTIHLLCQEDLSFSDELKNAVKTSEQLVFELDFDDPSLMTDMQAGLMMSDGQNMKSLFTEEEYAVIDAFTKKNFGQPADALGTMKPFFLMSMLYPQYLGCATVSMEMELMNLINKETTEVMGLETVEQQMGAIDALSIDDQADMLLESIEDFDGQKANLMEMLALYQKQDVDALYASSSEEFAEYEGFDEVMLSNRNKNWIKDMAKLMSAKQTFFAVGAAHLGGEEGVLNLLEKEGYTVKPIYTTTAEKAKPAAVQMGEIAQQLLGEWKIDEQHIEQITNEAIANAVEQNPQMAAQIESQRPMIEQMIINTVKEFKEDGSYVIVIPSGGGTQTGTWKVNEETKELIEVDMAGTESVKQIKEITGEILVTQKGDEDPRKYIRK